MIIYQIIYIFSQNLKLNHKKLEIICDIYFQIIAPLISLIYNIKKKLK